MAWLCFWQREWGLEKWLQFWDQSKGLSDICKCLFVNLISLEYPVGGRGWCWCHAIGRGRWGRTHHATRQIGCDMEQHATLHPPWRRRGGHLRWGWRQKIRCPRLIYSAQCVEVPWTKIDPIVSWFLDAITFPSSGWFEGCVMSVATLWREGLTIVFFFRGSLGRWWNGNVMKLFLIKLLLKAGSAKLLKRYMVKLILK